MPCSEVAAGELRSLTELVRLRAAESPDKHAFTYLVDGDEVGSRLTYGELAREVGVLGAALRGSVGAGARALLLYPPGLELVTAFLACLHAGVVAVPTFPPRSRRADERLERIAHDAEVSAVLTDSTLLPLIREHLATLGDVLLFATDQQPPETDDGKAPEIAAEAPAFLQYTSGSTAAPKGVIVTHGNILHNQEMIATVCGHDRDTVMVSWLPPYHDMGLIAGLLQPLYVGGRCVLMSPEAFLKKPVRWLQAITHFGGVTSGGPNFAYDLCVRKVTPEERAELDLSSWRVAFNGAEPVRGETLERFARVFAACGFARRANYPCYGLAEATLLVTGGDRAEEPRVEWFDADALEEHRVAPVSGLRERVLVSNGRPWLGQELRIVDPDSCRECPPEQVGEIWVAGPSVAAGYWQKPEETARDFGGRLADDGEAGPYLRTGDLGFLWQGELYVTGRLKDLIIVRGRNHYPQDIELAAGLAHPHLRSGGGAAFSVDRRGEERLVVVHEVQRRVEADLNVAEVVEAVRRAVAEKHEVHVWDVVLIRAGSLPKTSSGKVRRRDCRAAYLAGKLPVVGGAEPGDDPEGGAPPPAGPSREPPASRDELLALPAEERLPRLTADLRARLARIVGDTARIGPDQPLTALGLDSLRAIELSGELEDDLGVALPQARLLEGATLGELAAELAAALEQGEERTAPAPAAPADGEHPLSPGQRALWFLERLRPGTTAFMLSGALRVDGRLEAAALRRALERMVTRHPALRTTFRDAGGEIRQVVHETMPVEVGEEPLPGDLEGRLAVLAYRPLDLRKGPLVRLTLLGEQVLVVTLHHLIADLWSIGLFLDELEAFYGEETGGPKAAPPALAASYADYVYGQESMLASARGAELERFWRDALAGELPVLSLPTDRPRPAVPTSRGALATRRLDGEPAARLEALAQRRGVTLFTLLAAVFQALLHRSAGQDEVLVGVPTTGRGRAELRGVLGYFVNPVVLRGRWTEESFADYLERTRRSVLAAFAHQDYPFPLLAERLQPEREAVHAPIFQAMLVFQQARRRGMAAASLGAEGVRMELCGLECESLPLPCRDAQLDLTLYAAPWDDGLGLALEYAAELFDATTARRLLERFALVLGAVADDADRPLAALPWMTAAERAQVLVEWNDTADAAPAACLHDLVAAQAQRTPQAAAVICGRTGATLTYGELDRRAAALAARLGALGVGPEVRVGVCLPRTPDLVVALYGVLKAGGVYVPVDPEYPAERQAFMLRDAAAPVVVTDTGVTGRVAAGAPAVGTHPENLSHLIYTSGSTGLPKGVAIRHAAAVAMVRWSLGRYGAEELAGVLFSTSACFDLSVYEVFVPLARGGSVIVVENALALSELAERDRVTLVNTVPSAMAGLALPATVRTVNLAGEPLRRELADQVYGLPGVERVYNLYGPSEDTTYTTWARVPRARRRVTIGRPLAGTRVYLLDRSGRPVPVGAAGELFVAGAGLARGYLGRPALTAERFLPDPFSGGERLYRTGDLARHLPDGEIDFLGRLDHQVKVRGFRIELGEVESALLAHPAVRECVVVTREDAERGTVLVAYVAGDVPSSEALAEHLGERLPPAMVPASIVVLEKLPLTPNGKVDRRALPAPDWSAARRGYVAPRGPVEEALAGIWSEVLGVERIGADDRFFDLGGHSLLATQVLSRIREVFAVELPVRALFEAPALAALAARIEAQGRPEGRAGVLPPLERVARGGPLPLSFAQQRLWFLHQMEPASARYNVAGAVRLRGAVAILPLRRAVAEIVRRHEALRTTFAAPAGEPVQRIASAAEPELPEIDLTALPAAARDRQVAALLRRQARQPFDLARGPLLRIGWMRGAPAADDQVLWVTLHHIVSDGWSLGVFLRELTTLYAAFAAGRPSPLPELAIQYADFACWQRRALDERRLAAELEFWRRKLAGAPARSELPADRPRLAVQCLRGATCELRLPAALVAALAALGRQHGATPFMVLASAFQLLLGRCSGQDGVVVGFPVANRQRVEVEPLIGCFVNTLVLRTDLSGEPSFADLLAQVRAEVFEAHAHQELPFERLVEALEPERDLSRSPFFQILLVFRHAPQVLELAGLTAEIQEVDTGTAKFDLTLSLLETEDGLICRAEYSRDLFDTTTVRRLLGHYRHLLAAVADRRLSEPGLLAPAERQQVIVEWGAGPALAAPRKCLHELFEEQAARTPEAVAVVTAERRLTYRGLDRAADLVAGELARRGVGPEVRVGICLARSPELVVALLGVLKAGGVYVPIDPEYPAERQAYMLRDAAAPVVVTDAGLTGRVAAETAARIDSENLSHLIYTSGSTGLPKGVAIRHAAAVAMVRWSLGRYGAEELAGVLFSTSVCFDLSVYEVFVPLAAGGSVIVAESALALPELAERDRVTLVNTVPSAMAELALPARVRTVNLAGEPLRRELADQVYGLPGVERLYNLYGPSEDTTYTTWARVPRERRVTIGRPLAGTRVYLLDRCGRPVPIGAAGELFVAGAGLARGYLGRPALTAERFLPDPFADGGGERFYRTGDLARHLPDGEIDFLGRLDHQVKVRGFRIELGEVESALLAVPTVRECVVVTREDAERGTVLVAYVAGDGAAPEALAEHLGERLPRAMVPSSIVVLEKLPLTPNGKVDRRALPAPEWSAARRGYVPPRGPVEEVLAGLWSEVLGVERIGADDRFFDLGGHSLLATRLLSRVRESFAVELPVRAVFETPGLAALAACIEALERPEARPLPPPERAPRRGPTPLSFAQQRLWFIDQMEPGSPQYNVAGAVRLRGALAIAPLERAVAEIVRRHEALRTTFAAPAGEPEQRVAPALAPPLPVVDLTALPAPAREPAASAWLRRQARWPFDLARGPLLRIGCLKLADRDHGLWVTMHHVVSDGWSLGIFLRELTVLYEAFAAERPSPLPELPIQYADFACWQRRVLDEGRRAGELAFWRERLAGAPALLRLPADRPRPAVQDLRGATCELRLPGELVASLEDLGRRHGATLFMSLAGAFQLLLSRYSGQDDVVLGYPVANRPWREIEPLIGFFVNTLVLRTSLAGDPSFAELLARVRGEVLAAAGHQDVPFERLVEELAPERNLAYTPLFQVVLALQNALSDTRTPEGLEIATWAVPTGTSKFDLTLILEERDGALAGTVEYATALFDAATMRRFARAFRHLLAAAAARPDGRAAALPLIGAAERAQVLAEWTDTRRPYPREATVHELFAAQARRAPEAVAVVCEGRAVSYGELDARADRLARRLRSLRVGPETAVALFLERSVEMVVAVLGVLKAGGFYVPLDAAYPSERLALMLDDAGAGVLLTHARLRGALPEHRARVLDVERELSGPPGATPEPGATAESLCYVMYTSGSTGRPKGVAVPHRGVVRLVRESGFASFGPEEVFLQLAPASFDAATLEIWAPLANGGRLVVFPPHPPSLEELGAEVERQRVSTLWLTAGLFHQVAEGPLDGYRQVRQLLAGGDVLSPPHVRRTLRELPSTRLINGYGPTENTTFTCCHPLSAAEAARTSVPIGRPIAQTGVCLVDRELTPAPIGVPGELWITGDGLARGYVSRPRWTAERFVPDPFGREGGRAYRTGDLARHLADGRIEFLGRIDHQVKVRGFRIELGEVEVVLREHPRVRDAAVTLHGEGAGEKRLVAYVVTEEPEAELRGFLRASLPEHMVPSAFVTLGELPLTPNGKVDRRALPAPRWDGAGAGYEPPRTPTEELLAGIWAELLEVGRVGLRDDFFELGGHSLLATRVVSRIRQALGAELPVRALFEAPTVERLAARLLAVERSSGPALAPVPRGGPLPLSFAQERLWFLEQLDPGKPTYNVCGAVRLEGPLDLARFHGSVDALVGRHESLRTTFAATADGPVQSIAPRLRLPLPLVELGPGREAEALRLARREARRPFDLERGPLARLLLLRLAADDHVVVLNLHHVIADGWSLDVFLRELGALYSGAALAPLPVQYADYGVAQRRWLTGDVLERELDYWRRQLAGAAGVLELPADRPRPPVQSLRGRQLAVRLPPELAAALAALARGRDASLFMVLLAALDVLLHRLTGDGDLAVGTPVANRRHPEVEGLIGFFVNTLVLRVRPRASASFAELVEAVRETTLAAYDHQDLPFERLVEELRPERDLSRSPLFQVMFGLQNMPLRLALADLRLEAVDFDPGTVHFDLELYLRETGEGLAGFCAWDAALFDRTTIERLLGQYRNLLAGAAGAPETRLGELPWLGRAERHQLAWELNDTVRDTSPPACLHDLVTAQAERTPEAVALVWGETALTYGELVLRARRLADGLRARGVGPETRVAVCLPRTPELVVALLGVHLAGGAYVPIDPAYPGERQALMIADSAAAVLLSQDAEDPPLDRLPAAPAPAVPPQALSHVIYTSGSTGRPKGVAIRHAAAVARVRWAQRTFAPAELRRVVAATSVCFDLSVFEIFVPLASGGTVVLAADALELPALARREPTLVNTVPSAMAELARQGAVPASVVTVNLAGEPLRRSLADAVYAGGTVERVLNLYGPSEDTTYSTWAAVPRGGGRVTVGRPLAGTRAHVLDRGGRRVTSGAVGELYLGGDGLARGYLGRPALTAGRFVPDPFARRGGERLYRTGDLVRHRPGGELDFLGRVDHQVKVRGFRIELGEVESALLALPGVRECVVVARDDGAAGPRLVAYVAGDDTAGRELAAALRRRLPDYMVPAGWVVLDRLPLLPNGKVDRRALPAPSWEGGRLSEAPRTQAEELLAGIWGELLGLTEVGIDDDFFALGGHSLLATRAVSRIRDLMGLEIEVRALFEEPTVRGLARRLADARGPAREGVVPIARRGELPLSYAQKRHWFLALLHPESAAYNMPAAVRLEGELAVGLLASALAAVVRRHEVLQARFPTVGGQPRLALAPPEVELPVVDLGRLEEGESELRRLAAAAAARPFDLAGEPLLRVVLVRLAPADHVVLVNMHHIVSDGWSVSLFVWELAALYRAGIRGEPSPLRPLPIQYADFAAWQQSWLAGEALEAQLAYWKERLAGPLPALRLPTDALSRGDDPTTGAQESRLLDHELVDELRELGRRQGATLFMTLLAAFQVMLYRWSGQDDLVVGSPIAGRTHSETEPLIGCFLNTLALRGDLSGNPSFAELLARVRESVLAAWAHQDVPFEKVVEAVEPERDLNRNPIFDVMLNYVNVPAARLDFPGVEGRFLDLWEPESKFLFTLYVDDHGDELGLRLVYRRALFSAARMRCLLAQYCHLLAQVAAEPRRAITGYSLVAPETAALLPNPAAPLPTPAFPLLDATLARWRDEAPDRVALRHGEACLTYGELWAASATLARRLLAEGLEPGGTVAVLGRRSLGLIVGMLGVFVAGGVLLNVDRKLPVERRRVMLREGRARHVLLVDDDGPHDWLDDLPGLRRIRVAAAGVRPDRGNAALPEIGPDDPAYLFFTSGTTGVPKGVLGRHRSLAHFVYWQRDTFGVVPGDRASQLIGLSFDVVLRDVLMPLVSGAALCLPAEDDLSSGHVIPWLEREAITVLQGVPGLARAWLNYLPPGVTLPALRWVFFGGEPLTDELVRRWRRAFPSGQIVNLYGPTETTLAKTWFPVPEEPLPGVQPLGYALADSQILVLGAEGQRCGIGEPGEIFVRTPFRSLGYLNSPEETRQRFLPNPWRQGDANDLVYRSGDCGRYRPDGLIEILGRLDHQVKVHGVRVELTEIESHLSRHPAVREATVVDRRSDGAAVQLVAYYVPFADCAVTSNELRAYLRRHLPEAVVPAAYVELDRLPLNATGKVDRQALPEPSAHRPELDTDYVAPQSALERTLAALWQEALGVERVGVHDNFFDLGGHSFLLVEVQGKLSAALERQVPMVALFQHPTVEALARHLGQDEAARPSFRHSEDRAAARRESIRQRHLRRGRRAPAPRSLEVTR